jgi:hypothetical protein
MDLIILSLIFLSKNSFQWAQLVHKNGTVGKRIKDIGKVPEGAPIDVFNVMMGFLEFDSAKRLTINAALVLLGKEVVHKEKKPFKINQHLRTPNKADDRVVNLVRSTSKDVRVAFWAQAFLDILAPTHLSTDMKRACVAIAECMVLNNPNWAANEVTSKRSRKAVMQVLHAFSDKSFQDSCTPPGSSNSGESTLAPKMEWTTL